MIYGRKQKHLESNKEYDYIACLYPEGNLRADKFFFFNNEDIAERLYLSPHTVKNHIKSVYLKLDIHEKSEFIQYAHKNNLFKE